MKKYGNTLALDCATLMGWAVAIEGALTAYGETRLKRGEADLWEFLTDMKAKHHITRIVAESIFLDKNVRTFERLANYHGVIQKAISLRSGNVRLFVTHTPQKSK